MQSRIHSKNLQLSDDHKTYIEERIQRLAKYAGRISDEATIVDVEVHKASHKTSDAAIALEMTIIAPHATIRSEVNDLTIEAAADQAFEKMKHQIERYKARNDRRSRAGKVIPEPTLTPVLDAAQEKSASDISAGKIVKRKSFPLAAPCSDAEAAEQMELLGHTFFIYKSSDTGRLSVTYKRRDGNYGILEVE